MPINNQTSDNTQYDDSKEEWDTSEGKITIKEPTIKTTLGFTRTEDPIAIGTPEGVESTTSRPILEAQRRVLEDSYLNQVQDPKDAPQGEALMIVRVHFTQKIIAALSKVQNVAQTEHAAMHVSKIIKNARLLFHAAPSDPFVEIIMCIHAGLAFESGWVSYSSEQYRGALEIIEQTVNDRNLTDKKIDKAIIRLSDIGFELTFPENDFSYDD